MGLFSARWHSDYRASEGVTHFIQLAREACANSVPVVAGLLAAAIVTLLGLILVAIRVS